MQVTKLEMIEKEGNIVRTKPTIPVIKRKERLYLPASKCTLSIHARFQRMLSKCLRHDLNPSNEAELKTRLSMFERAQVRMQTVPYLRSTSTAGGPEIKKRLEAPVDYKEKLTLEDSRERMVPDWKQKYAAFLNSKYKYPVKDPKTKEELDEELEKYARIRAQIAALKNAGKPITQDLLDEINKAMNGVKIIESFNNSGTCPTNATSASVANSPQDIISVPASQLTNQCLDYVCDDTNDSSKERLDDDLEKYMRIARARREAKIKRMSNSVASSGNLSTPRLQDCFDIAGDIEMDEWHSSVSNS